MTGKTFLSYLLVLSWLVPPQTLASFDDAQACARSAGMGGAAIALFTGSEALFTNPAGMMGASGPGFAFFYSNPYSLKELLHGAVSAVLPTRLGGFGVGVQSFGQAVYRESTFVLGWGNRVGDRLVYGVSLRACHLAIRGYGSTTAFTVDAGCIVRLHPQTRWGLSFTNLNQARLGRDREVLPQSMRTGFAFAPTPNTLLALELDKDTRFPLRIKGGCEFALHPRIRLRVGFGTEPSLASAGIALNTNFVTLDYAFVLHPVLGGTHRASLILTPTPARPTKNGGH